MYLLHKSGEGQAIKAKVAISDFTAANAEAIAFTAPQLSSNASNLTKVMIETSGTREWNIDLPPYSLTILTFHKK